MDQDLIVVDLLMVLEYRGEKGNGIFLPDHVRGVNVLDVADLPMLGEVLLNFLLHERPDRRVHLVPVPSFDYTITNGNEFHWTNCDS